MEAQFAQDAAKHAVDIHGKIPADTPHVFVFRTQVVGCPYSPGTFLLSYRLQGQRPRISFRVQRVAEPGHSLPALLHLRYALIDRLVPRRASVDRALDLSDHLGCVLGGDGNGPNSEHSCSKTWDDAL